MSPPRAIPASVSRRSRGGGEYLKSKKPDVKIVAVEPATSAVLSTGVTGSHKIRGIDAGFVPDVLNTKVYDEIIPVSNEDAFAMGNLSGKREGVLVGISSGATTYAAIELAKHPENEGKTIVVLLPDTCDRYLSTPLLTDEAIRDDTCLVTVMYANDEIGTIQPISEIGDYLDSLTLVDLLYGKM